MNKLRMAGSGLVLMVCMLGAQAAAWHPAHKVAKPVPRMAPSTAAPSGARSASGLPEAPATDTKCRSELSPEALDRAASKAATIELFQDSSKQLDPMDQLKMVAQEAIKRSSAVGASKWLADAASFDLDQTNAGRYPTVSLNGAAYTGSTQVSGVTTSQGRQASVGISAGASLYDGGRLKSLIEWRKDLEKAAKESWRASQEAVVLEAVTTVLERNRYRMQAMVYQQNARKMACLVEALESIVAEDRGRTSELVQVRKNQAQAELSRDSATAQSRQIELKLRRLLGDQFMAGEAISGPLSMTPDLGELHRLLEQTPEAQQIKIQAESQEEYAQALNKGQGPQVNWSVAKTQGNTRNYNSSAWQAGISVTYALFDAGAEKAGIKAALARAEASRQQYADFVANRTERIASVHDNAKTSFDRAKRYVDILRDSDLIRNFTFQQWSQLGRRSLFDLMSAEGDHFGIRIAYVNSLYDGYEANTQLRSMGGGLTSWLHLDGTP